jgi:hypothetical protein
MIRFLLSALSVGALLYGVWWAASDHPTVKGKAEELFDIGSFHTLEVRYGARQIMETHRKELLKGNQHQYLKPQLKFYPYALLDVKYTVSDSKTNEGVMLWDLTDGEMVLDTKDWKKTHGFGDCINAGTERHEFKILNLLAKKGGSADREGLAKGLHVENEILDAWIDSCRKKHLIVQSGNRYRLHLEHPHLRTSPATIIDARLVTKPYRHALRVPRHFSISQIQKITHAAFGGDFAIRRTTDVYLPVHSISVQNPDGSVHTTLWNALNGKMLPQTQSLD